MTYQFGPDSVLYPQERVQAQHTPAPKTRRQNALRAFAFSDLLAFTLVLVFTLPIAAPGGDEVQSMRHFAASTGLFLAMMIWLRSRGHYRARQGLANQVRPILAACGLALLGAGTLHMMSGEPGLRTATIVQWAMLAPLLLGFRFATRAALEWAGDWFQPVTLLTSNALRQSQSALLRRNIDHGLVPETVVTLDDLDALDDRALQAWLSVLPADPVFLAPDEATQPLANRLAGLLSARGDCFYYQPSIGRIPTQNIDMIDYPPTDGFVFRIGDSLDRPLARRAKRVFDIFASSAALLALSPLMLVMAFLIRRDGGPALFVQPRVGREGETFGCLKFRTMCVDAEARLRDVLASDPAKAAQWATFQKLDDDPRITAPGKWMRKLSLDELPQLINVLKGEMSLIGPRPMTLDQQDEYGAALSAYIRMRPGITGLWQVNGRNATSFAERARLDDWYARNWSLWRDAVILIRTVREVLLPSGR